MIDNYSQIIEILGLDAETQLSKSDNLQDYAWDSLAMIMLQSLIDEEFDIQIDPDDLPEMNTIESLDKYINSFK